MMPASKRQLALNDMNEADGASLIGKISSRFTGAFMVLTPKGPPLFRRIDWGCVKMSPADSSCHLYVGVIARRRGERMARQGSISMMTPASGDRYEPRGHSSNTRLRWRIVSRMRGRCLTALSKTARALPRLLPA
jgi:hypothetical protein